MSNLFVRAFGSLANGSPSGEDFYVPFSGGGGGGGGGPATPVNTGVNYTTNPVNDTFVVWNTVTAGAKNTYVTTSGMTDGQILVIKDYTSFSYPMTIQALEGGVTIENTASITLTQSNGVSVNLKFDAETSNLMIW